MSLKIDYVEFYSPQFEATEAFFGKALGWSFVDYGPDYRDIQGAGLGAGLERAETQAPLIVLKSDNLEADRDSLVASGATLTKDIFDFPGGRRFEFREPGGTLMAAWTEG